MNAIEEGQRKGSSKSPNNDEPNSQFYGGMIYKQNENKSLYHYGNTPGATVVDEGGREDQWDQLRLIRDKCINIVRKYTSKDQ